MTVTEAVKLLKGWTEYGNEKHEVWREVILTNTEGEAIAKMLLDMENQIEQLKCCGNCIYYNEFYNLCKQPEREKTWGNLSTGRTDNCSMWESEL